MNSQSDIFKLLLIILLIANEKGGCGCDDERDPFLSNNNCSCFGSINSAILCCLLFNLCSCAND